MNCLRKCARFTVMAAILAAVLVLPGVSHALHATSATPFISGGADGVSFSVGASLGYMSGEALEKVWVDDYKLSELKWELDGVVTLGVTGTVGISDRFRVNAGFWTAVNEAETTMVDRDWIYYATNDGVNIFQVAPDGITDDQWTDESVHPDTTVDGVTAFDVNLDIRAFSADTLSLNGILGYKYDSFEWSARGGTRVYSTAAPFLFRDRPGAWADGELVIEYEQTYSIPYVGVGLDGLFGSFLLNAYLLYSPIVAAEDVDNHVQRATLFEGDYDGGNYVAIGVAGNYSFTERLFASAAIDYESISENRGDVTITSPEGTQVSTDGGSSELSSATMISILCGWKF